MITSITSNKTNLKRLLIISIFLILILAFLPLATAEDTDNDGITDDIEFSLAQKYSPTLYFVKDEDFFPVEIEYHLDNSNLKKSQDGEDLVNPSPTISEIGNYTNQNAPYYLDNIKGTVDDDGIKKDYKSQQKILGYTIYSHVTNKTKNENEYFIIQYWMFYAFNKGPLNIHEGDWEMVQIVLDSSKNPIEAMYSQHLEGVKTKWSNVEKDDEHIKIYVAKGSHANYFRSYEGKMSLAKDVVNNNGKVLKPEDYELIVLGELGKLNHTPNQDWLDYAGRWGDFGSLGDELRGKRGPHGPAFRTNGDMWNSPLEWGEDLNSVDSTNFKINWFFYNFLLIYIGIAAISLLIKLLLIYRRRKKTGLGNRIFSILYIDGFNLKSIGNIIVIIGMIFAILSIFYPWYGLSIDIDSGSFSTEGEVKVLSIDGIDGVQVNKLESNSGLVQLFAFPIPFSLIIGLGIFFLVISTVGILKSSKLGKKYLFSGIKFAIPILIILIFILQLGSIITQAPVDVPDESEELIETMSDSPLKGKETKTIGEYGTVSMKWGLEIGGLFLLMAGILIFIGGILEISARHEFFKPKSDKDDTPEKLPDFQTNEKIPEFQEIVKTPEFSQEIKSDKGVQQNIPPIKAEVRKEDTFIEFKHIDGEKDENEVQWSPKKIEIQEDIKEIKTISEETKITEEEKQETKVQWKDKGIVSEKEIDENKIIEPEEIEKQENIIKEFIKIPCVEEKEAKIIYLAGFRNLEELKNAEVYELIEICNFNEEYIDKLFKEIDEM